MLFLEKSQDPQSALIYFHLLNFPIELQRFNGIFEIRVLALIHDKQSTFSVEEFAVLSLKQSLIQSGIAFGQLLLRKRIDIGIF